MDDASDELTSPFRRGNALAAAGLHEAAASLFHEAGESGEENAWLNLGLSLLELGRRGEAEDAFAQGARVGDLEAEYELALIFSETDRDAEALEIHASLFARGLRESALVLAWYAEEAEDISKAKAFLRPLLHEDDDVGAIAAGMCGCIMWRFDQDLEAEPMLRRGSQVHARALFDLVRLLTETDRTEEAHEIVRRALDNGVDGAEDARDYIESQPERETER